MIQIEPFNVAEPKPSRVLFEVYNVTETTRSHSGFAFLGYVLKDAGKWIALTRKKNTPDSTHKLRRDAIKALQ